MYVGCNEKSTDISPKTAIKELKTIDLIKFKNWSISLRSNNMGIFEYNDSKHSFGFLCKRYKDDYFIKEKPGDLNKKFIEFSDFPVKKLTDSMLTNDQLKLLAKEFFTSKTFNINYMENFDGILFEKQSIKILFLLSDSGASKLPPSYKKIEKNWYSLQ